MPDTDLLSLSDPNGLLNPRAVAVHLGLELMDLAVLLRVDSDSLYRLPHSSDVQERLREVVGILACVCALMVSDGENQAVIWFKNQPIAGFGNLTAMTLVAEGRAKDVMEHLHRLENGGYA